MRNPLPAIVPVLLACTLHPTLASANPARPAPSPAPHQAPAPPAARAPAAGGAESFASTRNARVAYPIAAGTAPVARPRLTYLTTNLPPAELAALKSSAENVRIVSGLNRDSALAQAATAHAVDARLLTPALLAAAPNLVWAHSSGAGVEWLMPLEALVKSDRIVLTNSRAVHGPVIADHAMAMLLTLTRNLRFYQQQQAQSRWERSDPPTPSIALQGRTMLILGIGGIGSEIGQRAQAFGMRIIATRRTDAPAPAFVERVGKPQELLSLLPEADVIAVCVPLTPETEHLLGPAAFAAMKPGAILLNLARGRIIDTEAMMAALKSGKLRGAGLDVTDPEPLPAGHPLWKFPNVLITPHVSSDAELTDERSRSLLRENLRRFGAGEPLLNVVDKRAGY